MHTNQTGWTHWLSSDNLQRLSSFKVNWGKCLFLTDISLLTETVRVKADPYIKYLGLLFSKTLEEMYSINHTPALLNIDSSQTMADTPNIYLRLCECIKDLPRLTYLFKMLLIQIPEYILFFFCHLLFIEFSFTDHKQMWCICPQYIKSKN